MKRNLLSICMVLLLVVCIAGCGKAGFDSVPYTLSLKTPELLVEDYTKAKAGTYPLTANYETTITTEYPQQEIVETRVIKTTIGNYQNNYYCRIEEIVSVGDNQTGSQLTILYGGWKYVSTYDVASSTTTKLKYPYTGIYPKENTLDTLYSAIDQEAIEEIYEKVYEQENYYRLVLKLYNVNYSEDITRPEGTYYSAYSYEFGINKSGYIHMFNTYNTLLIDDWTIYRTQTIKTNLKEYGPTLYIDPPEDLNTYETV